MQMTFYCWVKSKIGLNKMSATAHKFSNEFNISFNPAKSKLLLFTDGSEIDVSIVFNGVSIKTLRHGIHLGNMIGAFPGAFVTANAIENASYDLYQRFNLLIAGTVWRLFCYAEDVLYELFKSFCLSYVR